MLMSRKNQVGLDGLEVWSQPAQRRSGDFTLWQETRDRITVVLGDVAGHDERSAEIAGAVKKMIALEIGVGLSEALLRRWQSMVHRRYEAQDRFVCVTILELDLRTNVLTVANAGNPDVLIHRGLWSGVEHFASTGMPLGLVEEDEWRPPVLRQTILAPWDYAFCISDGVIDRVAEGGERFGLRRVQAMVERFGDASPVRCLRRGLSSFGSRMAEQDDMSILMLRGRRRRVA